ncbi:MAG: DUF1080 domain-containing protein [Bryobacteraceae bacterium]
MHTRHRLEFLCLATLIAIVPATAQQTKGGGKRGGGPRLPEALAMDDHTGFESIFDGTMKGWDGNPEYWRAEGGALVGQTTAEKPLKLNTFLIWRGGAPGDFELKLEYKMNSTNSGIQYRSVELPEVGQWVLKGYQADIDYDNRYTGQLYEERGRGFLAMRGQATYIPGGGARARVIGNLNSSDALKAMIKPDDWNHLHIIAQGNMLTHILNGNVTSVAIDDDAANRSAGGLLGFQIHQGPPMKVEFRNIYLKKR